MNEPVRREEERRFPASVAQRATWLSHQLDPEGSQYTIAWGLVVGWPVEPAQMRQAADAVVRRHGALRTRFATVDGEPVQVVADRLEVPVELVDLRGGTGAGREARRRSVWSEFAARPFDVSRGPLLRIALVQVDDGASDVLFAVHHSVADARSVDVITEEVATVLAGGAPPEQPARQYTELTVTQRGQLTAGAADKLLAYWRRQLTGVPWTLNLPADGTRRDSSSNPGSRHPLGLDRALFERLAALARASRTTVFVVLLAVTGTLVSRQAGHGSVLIGTPLSNRDSRDVLDMVGPLLNTVPLRVDLDGDPDAAALLRRLRAVVIDALTHRELAFEQIVEHLRPERALGVNPLVQVLLALHEKESVSLPPGVRVVSMDTGAAKFDLAFTVTADDPEASFVEYRTDLFAPERIADLADQFCALLRSFTADPARPVSQLRMLSPAAEHRALVEWNATGEAVPAGGIAGFFEAQVRRTPDAVAITTGGVDVSYDSLNRLANALAHRLRTEGVGAEDRVGLCTGRSIALVAGILAILKTGAAVVPIEPDLPAARRRLVVEDAEARLVLTEPGLLDARDVDRACLVIADDGAVLTENATAAVTREWSDAAVDVSPDQLACVLYTSGSTGRPKGVMLTHRGVVNYVFWCLREFDVHSGSGAPLFGSIGFDTTVLTNLLPPLFSGARVHLYGGRSSPALALAEVAQSDADFSYAALTPSQLQTLMLQRPDRVRPVPARLLVVGGETLRGAMLPRRPDGTLGYQVINEYGPTETVAACCAYRLPPDRPPPQVVPIGGPISNTAVYVLDGHGRPVPVGVPGELCIGGAGVARGYLGRPRLTAAAFVPAPAGGAAGARVYRTGDLVRYRPGGALEFLGRIDDQVKIGGVRVDPGEVRAVLCAHPDVRDSAVLVRDSPAGTGPELIAYVVPDGPAPDVDALHGHLAGALPAALLPARYVVLDALPLTPNGKLDRRVLARFEAVRPGGGTRYVAPVGETESRLAAMWSELLQVEQVGAVDNFFALGGHSLAASRLLARIRGAFGVQLGLHTLFAEPTVRQLAGHINAGQQGGPGQLGTAGRWPRAETASDSPSPLSLAQRDIWFAAQLRPAGTAYHMTVAYHLDGPLRTDDLAASVTEVLRRHDVLRAVVGEEDGRPVLRYLPPDQVEVRPVDLSHHPLADGRRRAQAHLDAETERRFELSREPLARPSLLRLHRDEHVLVLVIHHLAVDGRSIDILVRDIGDLYRARLAGTAPPPAPALRYADVVAWELRRLPPAERDRQSAYWRGVLAGAPGPLVWPDGPVRAGDTASRSRHALHLGPQVRADLEELGRRCGVTLFTVLLAGYGLLLCRETRREDILVATPVDRRTGPETEDVVGLLLNMLVVRVCTGDRPSVRTLLCRLNEQIIGAYAHPDLPLTALVEHLAPERSRSGRTAVTQVMFDLEYRAQQTLALDGCRAESLRPTRKDAAADLAMSVVCGSGSEGLAVELAFDLGVLAPETVRRFGDNLRRLLGAMAAAPETAVGELTLTTVDERDQILRWSEGSQPS